MHATGVRPDACKDGSHHHPEVMRYGMLWQEAGINRCLRVGRSQERDEDWIHSTSRRLQAAYLAATWMEDQGQRSLVGCHLWGRTESDTTEAT